jgi:hypothetical protein
VLAETWDVGPNLVAIATMVVGLVTLAIQNHRNSKKVQQEFKPNGGSSTKDQLNRIESRQITSERRVTKIEEHLGIESEPLPPPPPPVA